MTYCVMKLYPGVGTLDRGNSFAKIYFSSLALLASLLVFRKFEIPASATDSVLVFLLPFEVPTSHKCFFNIIPLIADDNFSCFWFTFIILDTELSLKCPSTNALTTSFTFAGPGSGYILKPPPFRAGGFTPGVLRSHKYVKHLFLNSNKLLMFFSRLLSFATSWFFCVFCHFNVRFCSSFLASISCSSFASILVLRASWESHLT
mmetsp:Transcript_14941/g.18478  ORF Transcript_14941/g.18478 Transcript_14941/m.18478 type:complete len:204 (-) Transcript_14941:171-782(-)